MQAVAPRTGRVVCFGELLLRLSPPGRELPFQSPLLAAHFGGAEANVAASLSILGHASAMVSALPDNPLGRACLGELRRHGVDVAAVRLAPGRMGLYLLAPGAMQRPAAVVYDRAGSVFADMPADAWNWRQLLDGASWLHLSGINLALGESAARAALTAARTAREAGVAVSFDCNYRASLWAGRTSQAPALLREMLAHTQLLFAAARDIAMILGVRRDEPDEARGFEAAARQAFAAFPGLAMMAATGRDHEDADTQSLRGHLATPEGAVHTPSHGLSGIVERIGSGDAFAAGLLHAQLRGLPMLRALEFATAAACLKHSVPGDVNLLAEADIQAFVQQDGLDVKR